jgi:hypothetical protein
MVKNFSVMGIYTDRTTVADAMNVLQKVGYRLTDISVLWPENPGTKDFGHEKRTKALEKAAIGTAAGAMVGAVLAWLIATQAATTAAFAPLVAAGPAMAALAGAGALGGLGWIVGGVYGLRMPEYVARRYAGRIRRGGILMSIHCDSQDWCNKAKHTLKETGARHIGATAESPADYATADKPAERAPATDRIAGLRVTDVPEKESREL